MDDRKAMRELEAAAIEGRRSQLFMWMYRNHEAFGAVLRKAGKPNWKSIAVQFTKDGLLPADRKHETVRQTWAAVRKALAREAQATQPLQQSAAQPRDEFFPRDRPDAFVAPDEFDDIDRALGAKPE